MSASTADPASQLRQAALLTLKAKRRKPTAAAEPILPPVLSRPLVADDDSIMLDYGEDDSSTARPSLPSTSASISQPQPSSTQPVPPAKDDTSLAAQDVSMREEGEISENEDEQPPPPPPPPARVVTPVKPEARASPVAPVPPARVPSLPTMAPSFSRPPHIDTNTAAHTSSPSTSSAAPSHFSERTQLATPNTTFDEYAALQSLGYIIDENHVRPGLNMTQEQYNTAKDIVLDLLGWGVPPEYLVNCGLSREIVYYVFTELNLRLPANLDTAGILPYPPTKSVITALLSSMAVPHTPIMRSAAPVQYPSEGSATYTSVAQKAPILHSSNVPPAASAPLAGLSAVAPAFVPKVMDPSSPAAEAPGSSATLADMEQRTKQQLLARKAVLDSRKRGNSVVGAAPSLHPVPKAVTIDTKVASRPIVPQASVDDFLNSIDPTSAGSSGHRNATLSKTSSLIFASPDAMDVDDDIPGLGGFSKYFGAERTTPSRTRSTSTTSQDPPTSRKSISRTGSDDVASSSDEGKAKDTPAPSNEVASTTQSIVDAAVDGSVTTTSGPDLDQASTTRSSPTPASAVAPRRGTKRPVASDFVDVDSTYMANPYTVASLSRSNSTNGYGPQDYGNGHGAIHHPNPHVRRKLNAAAAAAAAAGGASFASVSSMRRCVIDVSDTEDEDGEEDGVQGGATKTKAPQPSGSGSGSGATPRPGSAMTEKSAVELELEIKKMREMIREREEMRLRKLAAQSSRSTRSSTPTAVPSQAAVPAPQSASTPTPTATKQETPEPPVPLTAPDADAPESNGGVVVENGSGAEMTPANGLESAPAGDASTPAEDFHKFSSSTPTEEASAAAAPGTPHEITGEQVLTAEARQEQVVPSTTPPPSFDSSPPPLTPSISAEDGHAASVDVPASTQEPRVLDSALEDQQAPRFRPYDSLFSCYPLLGHLPTPQRSLPPAVVGSALPTDTSTPDLRPLKARTFWKQMTALGLQNERICQYEVPGGGECRDAQCSDLHLSRVVVDPSDQETAMYLCEAHPTASNAPTMLKALQDAQARAPQATYEQHVGEAWASLVGRSTR